MSRKGNPWDNAACESFMKTLKYEEVHRNEYRDLAEARSESATFIEKVYNQKRLHSALGYLPPAEFEVQCLPLNKRKPLRGSLLYEFSQAWRNLSVRYGLDSLPVWPEAPPPWSAPARQKDATGDHTPCSSSAMSSDRLFLGGLLASIARLRFTGTPSALKPFWIGHNEFTSNGQQCLNCLSQPRGPPQFVALENP